MDCDSCLQCIYLMFYFQYKKKKDCLHHDSISCCNILSFFPPKSLDKEKGTGSKQGRVKGIDSDKGEQNNLQVSIWDGQEEVCSLRSWANASKVGGSL